jgi:hypothetical protein
MADCWLHITLSVSQQDVLLTVTKDMSCCVLPCCPVAGIHGGLLASHHPQCVPQQDVLLTFTKDMPCCVLPCCPAARIHGGLLASHHPQCVPQQDVLLTVTKDMSCCVLPCCPHPWGTAGLTSPSGCASTRCPAVCAALLPAGVYIDKTGDDDIDHDVEVVGWGETEDGLKYWEVRAAALIQGRCLFNTRGLQKPTDGRPLLLCKWVFLCVWTAFATSKLCRGVSTWELQPGNVCEFRQCVLPASAGAQQLGHLLG